MANYFIGDIQGCYDGLQRALALVEFNTSKDTLWLTGDLIARGPKSLETIKFLYKNQDSVKTVLGNHDLHFLSVANKLKKENPKDLLSPLLQSKKLKSYLDWLRQQPLVLELPHSSGYMSHAGLPPDWQGSDALYWSEQVQQLLQSNDYLNFLPQMYGKKPTKWDPQLPHLDKLKYAVNALTRMRYCTNESALEFDTKIDPSVKNDPLLVPWFELNKNRFSEYKWIFGHWASLMGKTNNPNVIALDTGYVWGQYLTIMNFNDNIFQQIPANAN